MNFGVPYMGSKSKIVHKICAVFPNADNFYDLFGGGFSVTHFMLERRKNDYKQFHFNEIRPGICELIKDAIGGKYNYKNFKPEFIDRETFLKEKENNAYIKMIWSFGNNGENYIFGKDIEPGKKSLHNAVVFNKFDAFAKKVIGMSKFNDSYSILDRRLFLKGRCKEGQQLERLQQLQQLERLEQLERLQQLEQLQRLEFYSKSYEQIKIKDNAVIYCDIPYKGTADYGGFDHDKFFDWADKVDQPLFISEYNIDDPRFSLIWSTEKRSLLSATKNNLVKYENVYANKAGYEAYIKLMGEKRNGLANKISKSGKDK